MKYNKNSIYEKPIEECPNRCKECPYFVPGNEYYDKCRANGCNTLTYSFSSPKDFPLPMPITCYWWYASSVWTKVSQEKIDSYKEMRLHKITASKYLNSRKFSTPERKKFAEHFYRPGGGCIIDFAIYPETKKIYDDVKKMNEGK